MTSYFCLSKMTSLLSIFLFFCLLTPTLQAQESPPDAAYYEQLREQYYLLLEDSNTVKQALRIKAKILSKLDSDGSMIPYNRAMTNLCGDFCVDNDLADWNYLGIPIYQNGLIQWNGFVGEVLADPASLNTSQPEQGVCLGTPTSGVFKYNANLPGWENRTDPLESPALGINKILRNAADPTHLIAATGIDHTDDYGGGTGLITSLDNGLSWSPWSSGSTSCYDVCEDNITGIYPHIDFAGNESDLNHAFYITVRGHLEDRICTFCAITSSTTFFDITPPWGAFKRIADFTANADGSVLVSTINPWGTNTELWYGVKNGLDCGFISWTNITANLQAATGGSFDPTLNQFISLSDSKNNIVFARTKGSQHNEIYRSTDGGLSWEMRFSHPQLNANGRGFRMLEYAEDSQLLYLGDVQFYVWNDQTSNLYTYGARMHADLRDIDFAGINNLGQDVAYIAHDGGVTECIYDPAVGLPGGMSFRPISGNTMPIQQFWGIGITQDCSGNYAAGAMHNNSFANVGGTVCKFGGGDGGDIEINPVDNSTVYFSINPSIRKADLNTICNSFGSIIGTTSQWQFDCPIELHPNAPCLLYYGDDKSGSPSAELIIYNDCGVAIPPNVVPLTTVTGNTSGHFLQKVGSIGLTEAAPFQVIIGNRDDINPAHSGKLLKIDNYSSGSWEDLSYSPVTNDGNTPFKDATAYRWVSDIVVSPYNKELFFVAMQGTHQNKRVFRTQDGGATFEDWSTGLPYVPVNNLEFLYNSNDLILAATDAGVYYRDNTMSSWECFNEGFPLVWTTDIDVNYCKNIAVATTHGRGIYETPLDNLPRAARQLEITGTVNWNKDRVVYSDVVVKSGATLQITNALIKFGRDIRILVEAGGFLNITSSELTALCEDACWDGITVEGNSNLPQSTANQGFAFISGSTISFAKSAINTLGLNNDFSQLDYNQMGGYFTCTNTTFLNNRRAVQMLNYENTNGGSPVDNLSRISNCQFLINNNYLNNCGSNEAFVTLFAVNGVVLEGNTFRDDRIGLTSATDLRTGIKTGEATFQLTDNGAGANVFENLYRGIDANSVMQDNPFILRVENATFTNNETGIRLIDVNNESHIISNNIEVGQPLSSSAFGVVVHNSSGYQIEDNYCKKLAGASGFTRGFDILNSFNSNNLPNNPHFSNHVIFNNVAQGLSEGFTAWGDHVADNGIDGLSFLCNQNISNGVDFRLLDCIQPNQGSSSSPAGNTFSCGSSIAFQLDAAAANCITYFHETSLSCTGSFVIDYPGITFSSTPIAAGCNYLTSSSEINALEKQIVLFPNPTQDKLVVENISGMKISDLSIFTMAGLEITNQWLSSADYNKDRLRLNTRELPKGAYLMLVELNNGETISKRFIKQ